MAGTNFIQRVNPPASSTIKTSKQNSTVLSKKQEGDDRSELVNSRYSKYVDGKDKGSKRKVWYD